MREKSSTAVIAAAGRIAAAAAAVATRPLATPERRTGILLVSFGTSAPKAAKRLADAETAIRAAFPGLDVRWGYTSHIVRAKLEARGNLLPAAPTTLAAMLEDGFTHVAIQPLYLIEGEEFDKLIAMTEDFKAKPNLFSRLTLGRPLLSGLEDMERVAATVLAHIPPERRPEEAVVFMGHGTLHAGHDTYARLRAVLSSRDPNVLLGTIEGDPEFGEIIAELLERGFRRVWLMPLLAMAGDHVLNDMAGDEPDSWKSRLLAAGLEPIPVLTGAMEYCGIVEVWVDHLKCAIAELDL